MVCNLNTWDPSIPTGTRPSAQRKPQMKKLFSALAVVLALFSVSAASANATPPTIVSPAVSGRTGANGIINLHYTLPDAANYPVSVTFTRESAGMPQTSFSVAGSSMDENLTFSAANPGLNPKITNSTGPIIDGTYIITVGYFSDAQGGYFAWEHAGVIVDSTTKPAVLSSPTSGAVVSYIPLEFTLPEDQAPGSLKLQLTGAGTCNITLADQLRNEQISIDINPASPASASEVASVASGCTLPDGAYTAALSYGDVWGNPVATTISSNVTIDSSTTAPTLLSPATGDIFVNRIGVSYFLPEAAGSNPQLVFTGAVTRTITLAGENYGNFSVTFDPAMPDSTEGVLDGNAIPDGLYSVKLQYQDVAGNPAASSSVATNVRVGDVPVPPDMQSPSKPVGLSASSITQTSAMLTWSASTDNVGVAGYHVFKDGVFFGAPADPSSPITLECGKTSHFSVSASDAAGNESAHSLAFDVTGAACDVPAPPIVAPPVTVPIKKCLAPIKATNITGAYKKGKKKVKYSLKISGKVAADGQSIKITGAKKNTTFYFKVDGKAASTSSITVANNPSLVTVIYKPTVGVNKTLKIQLTQVTC